MTSDGGDAPTTYMNGTDRAIADRDRTIEEHMWLVRCIVRSIADALPRQVDPDDLISAGTVGLIKAVDGFDPARGAKLETYARYRIRGAILDELRRQDILPYSARTRLRKLDQAVQHLERKLGRYPTDDEIVEQAGITLEEMSRLLAMASSVDLYSLDELMEGGEKGLKLDETREPHVPADPLHELERAELVEAMVAGIRKLPQMERAVLGLYYYEGLRMKEIGEVLGVSESRVSQVHSRAILLLRGNLKIRVEG